MNIFSSDKNYLGMLAIPVILFAVIASSNDLIDEKNVSEDADGKSAALETLPPMQTGAVGKKQNSTKQRMLLQAVESGNYATFLGAVRDTPFIDVMTEEAFTVLVEHYNLHKKGYLPSSPQAFGLDSFGT